MANGHNFAVFYYNKNYELSCKRHGIPLGAHFMYT